ncbi:MAG: hypothetical protein ABC595_07950 [Candidatus Methanosuratincola petrocarbonis]
MRSVKYRLEESGSGKTACLQAVIEDRFGRKKVSLSRLRGWRKEIAEEHLKLESGKWDDDAAKTLVSLEALKCARSLDEALKFLQAVNSLSQLDLHFWATKFLNDDKKPRRAWRMLYG